MVNMQIKEGDIVEHLETFKQGTVSSVDEDGGTVNVFWDGTYAMPCPTNPDKLRIIVCREDKE